jgi:hypothetical protein
VTRDVGVADADIGRHFCPDRKRKPMGTISISVRGKPIFKRAGDQAAIVRILESWSTMKVSGGDSPKALAEDGIQYMIENGKLRSDETSQIMQKAGIIWLVLNLDTGDAKHPGKLYQYAVFTDFDVNLDPSNGGFQFRVVATTHK